MNPIHLLEAIRVVLAAWMIAVLLFSGLLIGGFYLLERAVSPPLLWEEEETWRP